MCEETNHHVGQCSLNVFRWRPRSGSFHPRSDGNLSANMILHLDHLVRWCQMHYLNWYLRLHNSTLSGENPLFPVLWNTMKAVAEQILFQPCHSQWCLKNKPLIVTGDSQTSAYDLAYHVAWYRPLTGARVCFVWCSPLTTLCAKPILRVADCSPCSTPLYPKNLLIFCFLTLFPEQLYRAPSRGYFRS